jgi:uncharacterized membrane protein
VENIGELIWFVAYLIQMAGLVAGFALVASIIAVSLYEVVRRRVSGGVERSAVARFESAGSVS